MLISRKYIIPLIYLILSKGIFAEQNSLREPLLPQNGWQQLFDGSNIDDWSFVGQGDFAIKDKTLMSRAKMGLLWYHKQKFGNCVIRVIYKVSDPATSSAVFILMPESPKNVWDAVNRGYQIKIADNMDEYHCTGLVYSFSKTYPAPTKKAGEWNLMDIFLQGQKIKVYINQQLVTEFDPQHPVPPRQASSDPHRGPRSKYGYVGIQNHNDIINSDVIGQIWFKEIKVLPLPVSGIDRN